MTKLIGYARAYRHANSGLLKVIPRASLVSNVGEFVGSGFDYTDICCIIPHPG